MSSVNANGRGGRNTERPASGVAKYGYGTDYCIIASAVRRWRCLLSVTAQNAAPAVSAQCAAIGNRAGLRPRLRNDERARERGSDKTLDGSERLRPYRSHAACDRRVAAGSPLRPVGRESDVLGAERAVRQWLPSGTGSVGPSVRHHRSSKSEGGSDEAIHCSWALWIELKFVVAV